MNIPVPWILWLLNVGFDLGPVPINLPFGSPYNFQRDAESNCLTSTEACSKGLRISTTDVSELLKKIKP